MKEVMEIDMSVDCEKRPVLQESVLYDEESVERMTYIPRTRNTPFSQL